MYLLVRFISVEKKNRKEKKIECVFVFCFQDFGRANDVVRNKHQVWGMFVSTYPIPEVQGGREFEEYTMKEVLDSNDIVPIRAR